MEQAIRHHYKQLTLGQRYQLQALLENGLVVRVV